MLNSIVTNVIPPDVPSSRRGIAIFGQGEPVAANSQAKVQSSPVAVAQEQTTTQTVKTNEQGDTFVTQAKV